jgi:hypothetical protein
VSPSDLADYISTEEASHLSGFHMGYMAVLAATGKVQAKKFAGVWLISKSSLEAYLATERKTGPKPKPRKKRS